MAVILRNEASRMTTRNGTESSVPLRSSEIKIAQTGLVESLKSEGAAVKVLNLGYKGDHNVTRLVVKLWKENNSTADFKNRYEAAIVFYNEKTRTSYTASLSRNDTFYYVDIPQEVTQNGGNYQMYFLLKESLNSAIEETGSVGVNDDPTYREVFVSEAWKGVVEDRSGFSIIPQGFNWETDLYDYSKGAVTPYGWYHDKENDEYSASIYLAGLQEGKTEEDILYDIPGDFNLVEEPSLESQTYTITLSPSKEMSEKEALDLLDNVVITYPVIFDIPTYSEANQLHKTPIKIEYQQNSISVKQNQNLGMKYDSYITPIDVSSLRALPDTTKKYVVFAKDKYSLVCEAFGSYCWTPAFVTATAGTWQVSFIVKNESEDYIYYTGILKLPVVDNVLKKNDLAVDTAYRALLDVDGQGLYDNNKHALYVRSQSSAEVILEHSASTINSAIGWVDAVQASQISANTLIETINSLEEVRGNYDLVSADVATLKNKTTSIEQDITSINGTIEGIQEEIKGLDVTLLSQEVEKNTNDISSLKTRATNVENRTTNLETKTTSLENKDKALEKDIKTNQQNIETNAEKIKTLETKTTEIRNDLRDTIGRLDTAKSDIDILESRTDNIGGRVSELEDGYANQVKFINQEISDRSAADVLLNARIDTETSERKTEDGLLDAKITAEANRANNTEQAIQEDLDQTKSNLIALEEKHDKDLLERKQVDSDHSSKITTLQNLTETHTSEISRLSTDVDGIQSDRSIIRNDYLGAEKPFVAKIVFLNSEEEYNALEVKEPGTLYLIREDEE